MDSVTIEVIFLDAISILSDWLIFPAEGGSSHLLTQATGDNDLISISCSILRSVLVKFSKTLLICSTDVFSDFLIASVRAVGGR